MVTHGAGGQLHAVADQIVLECGDAQRIDLTLFRLEQNIKSAVGHGERVVAELKLTGLLADLVHREIDDPAELVALLVHVSGDRCAECLEHDARSLACGILIACADADEAVGLKSESLVKLRLLGCKELCDAACKLTVFVGLEPVGLISRLDLDGGAELVYVLAGKVAVGNDYRLDTALVEGCKARVTAEVANVTHFKVDAEVGLVGAVLLHRLLKSDAAEGCAACDVVGAVLGEHGRQHVLDDVENVLLRGKRHLHVELIELAGAAVASCVLVTEAWRYLEIAVKAGGHEQLLKLLGRLRQSIELAGVLSCGNEVVSRTFGAGCGKDGGRDLKEIMLHHRLAQSGDNLAAQDYVLLDCGVAQVEVAVFKPCRLVRLKAAVYLKGQLVVAAAAKYFDLFGNDLDIAGGQLEILAVTLTNASLDRDGAFLVYALYDLHHLFVFNDDLRGAVEVTQNDEGKVAADLTDVLHPADELNLFSGVLDPELAAVMCAHLCHGHLSSLITGALERCSMSRFISSEASSMLSFCWVPLLISLRATTFSFISSSPISTA